jgi:hypothetical protein
MGWLNLRSIFLKKFTSTKKENSKMLNRIVVCISLVFALVACEEPPPLTSADLVDNSLLIDSDFKFSAYVDVFPLRTNNVSFAAQADNTYKIIARDGAKNQRIEITLPELKLGAYNINIDSTTTLKFFSEEKAVFSSNTERIPSDLIFMITEIDSTSTLYSGSFSATTYLENSNQVANKIFQRRIYSGRFKDIVLQ